MTMCQELFRERTILLQIEILLYVLCGTSIKLCFGFSLTHFGGIDTLPIYFPLFSLPLTEYLFNILICYHLKTRACAHTHTHTHTHTHDSHILLQLLLLPLTANFLKNDYFSFLIPFQSDLHLYDSNKTELTKGIKVHINPNSGDTVNSHCA